MTATQPTLFAPAAVPDVLTPTIERVYPAMATVSDPTANAAPGPNSTPLDADPGGLLRPGAPTCYCTTCHQYFKSAAGFDKHRIGDYEAGHTVRCRTAPEMHKAGMSQDRRGFWITAAYTGPRRGQQDGDA